VRTATTISAIGHAAVVLWSIWSLAARPLPDPPGDILPIDLVTTDELSKITQGMKDAAKVETPKPLVEKIAEAKPVDDPAAKVVENKEVKAARDQPPAPDAKPVEVKPEETKAQTKADHKPAEAKPDPIGETLAKEEQKKAEAKTPTAKTPTAKATPPKKPAPPAPKFDPHQVAALLDKRDATRVAAAGETLNPTPSLGLASGRSAQLSMNELDALRARLAQLWNPPAGAQDPRELVVEVRIRLKPDGTLAASPEVLTGGRTPLFLAARDSAIRALYRGQPFNMLRPEHYEQWKDIEITFDPRNMIRG
jgi:chemotaxis protein histidine kinase CheA